MPFNSERIALLSKNLLGFNDGGKGATGGSILTAPAKIGYHDCFMKEIDKGSGKKGLFLVTKKPEGAEGGPNARYIVFNDGKTCLATMSGDVYVLASGGFSGCVFQLWRDNNGGLWGAHVYSGDKGYADISVQALRAGWRLLYHLPTAGRKGTSDSIFVIVVKEGYMGDLDSGDNLEVIVQANKNDGSRDKLLEWDTIYDWEHTTEIMTKHGRPAP